MQIKSIYLEEKFALQTGRVLLNGRKTVERLSAVTLGNRTISEKMRTHKTVKYLEFLLQVF
jgi:hypothetical protein